MADAEEKLTYGDGFSIIAESHFSLWEVPPGSVLSMNSPLKIGKVELRGGNIVRVVETDAESGWVLVEVMVVHSLAEHSWNQFWLSIDDIFRMERNARIGSHGE